MPQNDDVCRKRVKPVRSSTRNTIPAQTAGVLHVRDDRAVALRLRIGSFHDRVAARAAIHRRQP